jgi:hypothetical protein
VIAQQPGGHCIDRVQDLPRRHGNSQPGELGNIGSGVFGWIVGEEEDPAVETAQGLDQRCRARQEVVAKVDRAIEIEDIAGEERRGAGIRFGDCECR